VRLGAGIDSGQSAEFTFLKQPLQPSEFHHMNPFPKSAWATADRVLATLTLDQCLGQFLCPDVTDHQPEALRGLLDEVPIGCMFIGAKTSADWRAATSAVACASPVPVMVASDFEHGAGCMIADCATDFPWAMAAGAADEIALVHTMGEASAREGRAHGAHWTLGPMIDLAINPNNPVVNTRAIGSNPTQVARLGCAWIEGIQTGARMAACAKHFPGDGTDDRDQHLCTSLNKLDVAAWRRTYGRVWQAAIKQGTMSVMIGHIGFPAYERKSVARALPATLSPRLMQGLLREELGFEGVILSDAMIMGGITSRVSSDLIAVEFLRAGGDVVLFADARSDFAALQKAVVAGRLTERSVREKTRRILAMKATLGLFDKTVEKPLTVAESKRFGAAAKSMAEKSLTLYRGDAVLPAKLKKGAKVLTVTVGYEGGASHLNSKLPAIDEELKARGFTVDHLNNPGSGKLRELAMQYDRIFINVSVCVHSLMGTVSMVAPISFNFWMSPWVDHPGKFVFTAFGNPWLAHEQPHLPNLLFAYGNSAVSQRAAVRGWLGELKFAGKLPITA